MNFTVDDADPSISYSTNGWNVQFPNDTDLDQFFERTYHVAVQDRASLIYQFVGSAFTLYGSKGPEHVRSLRSSRLPNNERLTCARMSDRRPSLGCNTTA